ncbi:uncharacterized protein LOC141687116 [Apium graveolens]|uniref:uncharacterized protein LOC141687116 n=1 Tax=Apium graveolens TaxID=4045 RepID=UPI003D78B479
MGEVKHFFHEHELKLNDAEAVSKDVECAVCRQPVNKLIDAFYSCNTSLIDGSSSSVCVGFFMHKSCSELPLTFTHPMFPQHPLSLLEFRRKKNQFYVCSACHCGSQGFFYGIHNMDFFVCLKCVKSELRSLEGRTRRHPGHNHALTLVQKPALFLCDACNTTATDLAYICTQCCFYIHKSCANLPITYQSKFHKEHTLILDYSLPQEYRKFYWLCGICGKFINHSYWVYYCANCRFFAHVKCASSTEMLRVSDDDEADSGESNLMHFPAPDEISLHKMMQQCIMTKATDALRHKSATTAKPLSYMKHWAHKHQLALRNRNAKTLTPDLNQKLEESELLTCDGCTKPILVNDIFYECNSCNFFLHRSCAQFPEKMKHHLAGYMDVILLSQEVNELAFLACQGCLVLGNGIFLLNETACFDIRCASLPRKIKHEGHRHPLNQLKYPADNFCQACWLYHHKTEKQEDIMYGCEKCGYYIHILCALRPHLVKHRWDPHPLYLILFVQNVADHPHDFDCEFCSKLINPNSWFYHCNVCDLSFHTACIDPYYGLSNMKFGATNIHGNSHTHQHGLTVVLNKKMRKCKICGKDAFNTLVLECSPCKYLVHGDCFFEE